MLWVRLLTRMETASESSFRQNFLPIWAHCNKAQKPTAEVRFWDSKEDKNSMGHLSGIKTDSNSAPISITSRNFSGKND